MNEVKVIMKIFLYIIIVFIPIIFCTTTCASFKNIFSDESVENIFKLDNLITEELHKQDYDIIYSIPNDNGYYIKSLINNYDITMKLDTGSTHTLLKLEYLSKFKLRNIDSIKYNKIKMKPAFSESFEFYPVKAETLKIGSITLSPWPLLVSNKLAPEALLGCEFLHLTKAIIICNPGILCISLNSKPASNIDDILKNDHSYKEIDLILAHEPDYITIQQQIGEKFKTLENGVLLVPVTCDEISGFAIIDTGASLSMVDSEKINRNLVNVKIYSRYGIRDSAGTKKYLKSINVNRFLIDKYHLSSDFKISFMEMKNKDYIVNNKAMPILGLIGLDVLYKNNAIIDYGNCKLYLQIK